MKFRIVWRVTICCLLFALTAPAQEPPERVTRSFLPPRARLVELRRINLQTGDVIWKKPAVFRGHIVSPDSNDIVFAYSTPEGRSHDKSLFIALLHKTDSGYVKLYEVCYYGRILMAEDALKLLRISNNGRETVVVFAGIGASLGGQLEVFRWDEVNGFVNVMPPNGGVHHVKFKEENGGIEVTLSAKRYPGQKDAPPPRSFRWDGQKFVE